MRTATLLAVVAACHRLAADDSPRRYLSKPPRWFSSDEARRIAATIMSHQAAAGGWPKNTDTVGRPYSGDPAELLPTFDNKATVDEIRFMARMFAATGDAAYRGSFDRGLDYVLAAQYPNGGWPQFYPLRSGYKDHITFNDDAMTRVMRLVREVGRDEAYAFVDAPRRDACRRAFDRGIDCILRCQIIVDGERTVWCAQHDEHTFAPAKARAYELPSFSGSESVGIVRLLMSVEHPSPEVREAVESAVRWFRRHAITGLRIERTEEGEGGPDTVMVPDPTAPQLWARFYDLETGRPFVCDRDGVPKASLAEIGHERRNGYGWFGEYARDLIAKDYPAWTSERR